jgi:Ca2+-binding RTX toxin-like protein
MARATIRLFDEYYTNSPSFSTPILTSGSKSKAVWTDASSGDKLVFQGANFDYEHGIFSGGTIKKLTVVADGETTQVIGNLKIDIRFVTGETIMDQLGDISSRISMGNVKWTGAGMADAIATYGGNDLLFGKGGDDTLSGGLGRDVMVGGTGSDTFVFSADFGKDVIKDFDADGGAGMQDFIDATFPGADAISKSGKNTVIDFGSGDTLTLLNILPSQIDASDFV